VVLGQCPVLVVLVAVEVVLPLLLELALLVLPIPEAVLAVEIGVEELAVRVEVAL
jgi:hypothetical protein